jgi:TPR repeat protein
MKKTIIFLTVMCISFSNVFAEEETVEDLRWSFLQEQHKENMLLAEQGNADAQYKLVFNYAAGKGVEADVEKAVYWLKKSASNDNPRAQLDLGIYHLAGGKKGIPKDDNKAIYWIKKSAEQGYSEAQAHLSVEYVLGETVEKDIKKSVFWTKKASEGGVASAQYRLGRMYLYGHDVLMDKEKGIYWLEKSANQDYVDSQKALAEHYLTGDLKKTADDGLYWLKKAAKLGDSGSQLEAGRYYNLAKKDYKESAKWLSMASDQDNKEAQGMLAGMYIFGKGVEKNMSKAKELIKKAFESNDSDVKERAKKKWEEFELWKY